MCVNAFGYLVCQDMYSKAMSRDFSDYVRGPDSYIAIVMANDSRSYVNETIKKRLKSGITSGTGGSTNWKNNDLRLSIGHCNFSWKVESYDKDSHTATVLVHITDEFDFNPGEGKRSADAEKLTALGRKAELTSYKVDVKYYLNVTVNIQGGGN